MFNRPIKTDNSHFPHKIALREFLLPPKKTITVLDAFSGDGKIWNEIKKRNSSRVIKTLRIEKQHGKKGIYLKGDNRKFLLGMNIASFDVIDLDAYANPFDQLEIIFPKLKKGQVIFITYIQRGFGQLQFKMLESLGISKAMYSKCPTIFGKLSFLFFKSYLSLRGVENFFFIEFPRTYYIAFKRDHNG